MKVLGIIPARGGSKEIPRKNLLPILGKPLLAYTADAALLSKRIDRVVLSTDDVEIAEVGRALGLDVPFLRPAELAQDHTPTLPVLQHAVTWLEQHEGYTCDAVFTLQPTSPLRTSADIDGAVDLLERTSADSVISLVDVGPYHPARMKTIASDGRIENPEFAEAHEGQPRQELPAYYLREGSVYLTRRNVLFEQASIQGRDSRAWLVSSSRVCNIDSWNDVDVAEKMLIQLRHVRDNAG